MNWVHPLALLLAAWTLAFAQCWFTSLRSWLWVQPDVLPALVVYAGLSTGLPTAIAVAVVGGLGLDALSSGPFGLGMVPLVGLATLLHLRRDVLLRDTAWAQATLCGAATLAAAIASFALPFVLWPFLSGGEPEAAYWPERLSALTALPAAGPGLIWQWLLLTFFGAAAGPVCFGVFRRIERSFNYQPVPQVIHRGDREIKRGRS